MNMNMKNIVGQPLDQLVRNTANSAGKGPTHLKNTHKKMKINIAGWLF